MAYDHISIEQKWQKFWSDNKIYLTRNPSPKREENSRDLPFSEGEGAGGGGEMKPKKYILDMFPYPSGAGLHVGHPKGYTATDIISRYYHANGYNVLHPMGFDAFGLPAENYAIKTGTHPAITTAENIATFTTQLRALGFSYDWDRVVDTTDPEYYKWTQWIFLELFKRGLAYEQDLPINYCPSCKTGLANEEVLSDNTCDRCGTRVERRPIRQWVLKITEYAERLIDDIEGLDWPEGIKEMQRNWIGKSEGCEFRLMKKVESKPVALILHGWGGNSQNGWKPWLKNELEKMGYDVIVPDLPNTWEPNLDEQLKFLGQYKNTISKDSIIIGHSIGALLACHFVARNHLDIKRVFCIGPVYDGLGEKVNWTSVERGGIELQNYISQRVDIRPFSTQVVAFLSDNDPYIKYPYAKQYFDATGVEVRTFHDMGHFNEDSGVLALSEILDSLDHIRVYTTRVDTVFGMTYAVLAPDHPKVQDFITSEQKKVCEAYIANSKSKSDQDRTADNKEKTGVFTGSYVINPYNGESVPLWIADYVLGSYGTGAVMAVPAHDERDGEFAKKYNLPIRQSVAPKFVFDGITKPKPDKEILNRRAVDAIIENAEGKILLLREERGVHFPGGGTDGEQDTEALRREIIEETGYTDFVIGERIISDHYLGYRKLVDKNVSGECVFYAVKLLSENRIKSEVEEGKHEMFWESKENIDHTLTWENHRFAWKYLVHATPFTDDGFLTNSGQYDGLSSAEVRQVFIARAESEGFGHKKVNYKLRDWLFSRQRYWGEPIPLIHISHEDYAKLPRVNDPSEATESNLAYIYDKSGTEKRCKNCTCGDVGCIKLIINGKTYSRVYDGINGKIVIEPHLPLTLPEVEKYEPAGDGQSPLATVPEWVNIRLADNLVGKRETNTMPQWGGSCWYYLRYMDNKNSDALAGKEALDYWGIVDEYVGGAEHAVLHLLYARFWHKVLYDIGVVSTKEPFQKLVNQGMILAYAYERDDGGLVAVDLVEERDGRFFESSNGKEVKQVVAKMSKSLKNVVNPNDIVSEYGADTLRLYEMNMAGFTDTAPWNPEAIVGVRRFLDKAYSAFVEGKNTAKDDMKAMKLLHKTVKKVGEDIVGYKFNTAISALMILLNEGVPSDPEFAQEWKEKFTILLHPFAPHMAEELYTFCHPEGNEGSALGADSSLRRNDKSRASVYSASWPEYDDFMLVDDEVTIAVQVNGKLRGTLTCLNGVMQEEVSALAHEVPDIMKWIEGKTLVKEIYIPNKLLSIVVKEVE